MTYAAWIQISNENVLSYGGQTGRRTQPNDAGAPRDLGEPLAGHATPATKVQISDRAKQLLARASAEQSVVLQLMAQINALRHGASPAGAGDGGNRVSVYDHASVTTGAGNDVIDTYGWSTVNAGDGNNRVSTYDHATVTAGAGNDVIDTYGWSTVNAGDGNNRVSSYDHATVNAGAGNDMIDTYGWSTINAGDGNNQVNANDHATVTAGAGNDVIGVYGWSTVNAGDGNNRVSAYDYASVTTGAGNDVIDTYGWATIAAGGGNDSINAGDHSSVQGGAGNDIIRVGSNSTVTFGKGDGRDVISSGGDLALAISGYSQSDLTVTRKGNTAVLSFKGSEDSITLDLNDSASATLSFADNSTLNIKI